MAGRRRRRRAGSCRWGDGEEEEDPAGGRPGGAAVPRRLAALAAKLARLRAAQDKLTERQAAPAPRLPGSPPPRTRWMPPRGG